ncbi:hypothetical protein PR002_g14601 [Phytophthora rubi]|uniref:RxLR effector protein n=1 Tax=Phytophthora rubi TaxID=129364 RepID=A0A6A3L551_9STRA|nr:hypothetical protein PR002_g14601 [Phytophthora rubi]
MLAALVKAVSYMLAALTKAASMASSTNRLRAFLSATLPPASCNRPACPQPSPPSQICDVDSSRDSRESARSIHHGSFHSIRIVPSTTIASIHHSSFHPTTVGTRRSR